MSEEEFVMDREEIDHLMGILRSMTEYESVTERSLDRAQQDYARQDEEFRKILSGYIGKLQHMLNCVHQNQLFLNQIVQIAFMMFPELHKEVYGQDGTPPDEMHEHHEKVRVTLTQMVRDWSEEGKEERAQCYGPILRELEAFFPDKAKRANMQVLAPGCGLARLPWEIARLGFQSEGNEFTYFMLISANFILHTPPDQKFDIYPFASSMRNSKSEALQCRKVVVPDTQPDRYTVRFQAGDFLVEYRNRSGYFDSIATCFFLDTAKNVLHYVENIARLLKPGGLWVNLGPLLYHFSEMNTYKRKNFPSLELTYEELKGTFSSFGLRLLKEEFGLKCVYNSNIGCLATQHYRSVLFTCVKEDPSAPPQEHKSSSSSSSSRSSSGKSSSSKSRKRRHRSSRSRSKSNSKELDKPVSSGHNNNGTRQQGKGPSPSASGK